MPEKKTLERAREDAREGKAPSTQAGEFVRGDGAYPGRQARCSFCKAGDRNRALESQAGGSEVTTSEGRTNIGEHAGSGGTQLCSRADVTRTSDITH